MNTGARDNPRPRGKGPLFFALALSFVTVCNGIGKDVTWVGDGVNNQWDFSSTMWTNAAVGAVAYADGDAVRFDDTGSASPAINLTTTVQPASLILQGSKNYTLSGAGSLAGTMKLTWAAPGILSTTNNTYTGGTEMWSYFTLNGDNVLPVSGLLACFAGTLDLGGSSRTQTVGSLTATYNSGNYICSVTNGNLIVSGGVVTVGGGLSSSRSDTLDMRGADSLTLNSPSANLSVAAGNATATGELFLPARADLTATSINVAHSAGYGKIHLGQSTVIRTDLLWVSKTSGNATIDLQAGLTAPTVKLRGQDGDSPCGELIVGFVSGTGTSTADINLLGATLDGVVGSLVVGRNQVSGSTIKGYANGFFSMGGGTLIVTDLILCYNVESGKYNAESTGLFTQTGGVVRVERLTMGKNLGSGSKPYTATYNLTTATLYAREICAGSSPVATSSSRTINLSDGTLRNYADTNLVVSGLTIAGGMLKLVLASATTNTFYADAGRSITVDSNTSISGTGALAKEGPGALILNSVNSYSGVTAVNAGTLLVSGTGITDSSTTVMEGSTFGASGTALTSVRDLTLKPGAKVAFTYDNAANTSGCVVVTGTLTLPATATVSLNGSGTLRAGQYVLFSATGGAVDGATDLSGWTFENRPAGAAVRAVLVNKQVILRVSRGTMIRVW